MKRSLVTERKKNVNTTAFMMTILTLAVSSVISSGCASLGSGGSGDLTEEEQILQTLTKWKVGLETLDAESFLAAYSENYEGEDGIGKEGLSGVIEMVMDAGYLDGIEVNIEEAKISVEGTMAEVSSVLAAGPQGSEESSFTLEKEEDGVWRIVRDLE